MVKIHHRPKDLEGLYQLALRLVKAQSHEELLTAIAEETMKTLRADRGFLLLGASGETPRVVRSWGGEAEDDDMSRTIIDHVMEQGEPILIQDALEDDQFSGQESVQRLGIRAVLAAPLKFGEEVRGAFYLETTPDLRIYAEEELDLFQRILDLASEALESVTRRLMLEQRSTALERDLRARHQFSGIVTSHSTMFQVLETLGQVATTELPILIQGESGTGKELLARAVYVNSRRSENAFQTINCAAISPTLIESELFGHVKGAFTGAVQDKRGMIAEADGGTVFLDEVGELPLDLQAKLLRTLQFGEVQRVGSARPEMVNVRFVAATNKVLADEVAAKRFREDLYFRLNAVLLEIPPLRERREDILLLFEHFVRRECERYEWPVPKVADGVRRALAEYSWPGNVRQLENETHRMLALSARNGEVTPQHLSRQLRHAGGIEDNLPTLEEMEKRVVESHLRAAQGNKSKAARTLGISREGLRKKLARWAKS